MRAAVAIEDREAARLVPPSLHAAVFGEVHDRQIASIPVPSRILQFAFNTSGVQGQTDRANVTTFCEARELKASGSAAKHHRAALKLSDDEQSGGR